MLSNNEKILQIPSKLKEPPKQPDARSSLTGFRAGCLEMCHFAILIVLKLLKEQPVHKGHSDLPLFP